MLVPLSLGNANDVMLQNESHSQKSSWVYIVDAGKKCGKGKHFIAHATSVTPAEGGTNGAQKYAVTCDEGFKIELPTGATGGGCSADEATRTAKDCAMACEGDTWTNIPKCIRKLLLDLSK